ncbi:hypothetical protein PENTCL1PPCAC_6255, partial [Pristionchus entomophagus]
SQTQLVFVMSAFGAFANSDPVSQNNFNPSWMGQTFNATSGVPRNNGRPVGPNGGEGEEDRPMAAPIFMRNRYGREDVLALYDGGSVHPPDGLPRCPLYQSEPQPPCVIKPLSEIEKKLRENINSSKAMSLLSAADRHHITSGGTAPESPQAPNRSNTNGWTHVPPRDHNKTWGRTTTTGTTPVRGSVRGAFSGGRGGGTAGGGVGGMEGGMPISPYGVTPIAAPQNGERALGTGGTFPSRRGVNPVARGGGSSAFNSRAQGLYNPHDPSDRPRPRGRSTSEDGEGGPTATPTTPGGGGGGVPVNGGQGGAGAWQAQSRQTGWTRSSDQPQRMPEWANDEEGGMAGGVSREHSSDVSSGTFDEQGRFMRSAPPRQPGQSYQQPHASTATPQMQHEQQQQLLSPQSSMQTGGWREMEREVPSQSAPMEIPHSSHYSMGGVPPTSLPSLPSQQQQQDGPSGMSPSSAFLYAYQQKQLQQQQQAQYAAMQQAQQQQQQQPPAPTAPSKPANFFYLDPNGVERGPFPLDQMEAWFSMGYFQDTLQVRRESDSSFTELGELQKRNGKNPFKYPEPVVAPPPVMPTPNMLAGYMDQMGLSSAGGWDQSVQSIFARAQTTPSYEALLEKQRMEEQARRMTEEREKLVRMQEMMRLQAETEREQHERLLREKEEGLQKMQDEMNRKQREMEEAKREHEATLEKEKREIERKKAELEKQNNREKEEQRKKQEAERRRIEEIEEKKRGEQERMAAAEEVERAVRRAEEAKRHAEEERKRQEEDRKKAEAYARVEELRLEAEREAIAERERQAQIAAARRAAAAPAAVSSPTPAVVKSSGPAWGGAGISTVHQTQKKSVETRSLAEVMAEEERQARAEQRENERLRRETETASRPVSKGGVWGGVTPSSIASQAVAVSSSSAAWGGAGLAKSSPVKASPWAGPSLSEANKPKAAAKTAPAKTKAPEKVVKKDEKKKTVSDEAQFISWFISRVRQLNDTVDGDVLASFIQGITNPDEVEDYMVGYLGDGKQVTEFVREYIHKRSELRNKTKGGVTASSSSSHDKDGFSSVPGKKGAAIAQQKKKPKFVVDSACLGFRPTGDPNRVNQGEIDHPESSTGRR